jgi:hypothetical protein
MSVKIQNNSADKEVLELAIDNGDKEKLEQALKKWQYKDYQSLLRFTTSVLLVTQDKSLWIVEEEGGELKNIAPSDELINQSLK